MEEQTRKEDIKFVPVFDQESQSFKIGVSLNDKEPKHFVQIIKEDERFIGTVDFLRCAKSIADTEDVAQIACENLQDVFNNNPIGLKYLPIQ